MDAAERSDDVESIYALSTAAGRAGVAVVRISGPAAPEIAERLFGGCPTPRYAAYRGLRDPLSGDVVDHGLVLFFPEGSSFTGENIVEFQGHGGRAVLKAVLSAIAATGLARMAEPGEFTRRALENGRLDLSQVEGLADLIDAETEAQRRQAMRVLSGALGERVAQWREDLTHVLAQLVVSIDFADEDIPEDVLVSVDGVLDRLRGAFLEQIQGARAAEEIRDGIEVAIVGAPNAGKSTLINHLLGRDIAITSEQAGTTRDVLEARIDLGGCPVVLLDTAGLRESEDEIEAIGVERARLRAEAAEIRVFLVSGMSEVEQFGIQPRSGDLIVGAKGDIRRSDAEYDVSGATGHGVRRMLADLASQVEARTSGASLVIRERHRRGLMRAIENLDRARDLLSEGDMGVDLAAEELRGCARALDTLVGRIDVEDILDDVFSRFCMGK